MRLQSELSQVPLPQPLIDAPVLRAFRRLAPRCGEQHQSLSGNFVRTRYADQVDCHHGPHAGREFTFDGHDNFIVGRSKAVQFRLSSKDQFFSRNHFLVEVNPPLCRLLDLNSTNGTHVNGKPVTSIELHDGDTIEAGDTTLRVSLVLPASATLHPASESDHPSQLMPIARPNASQQSSTPPFPPLPIVSPQRVGDQTLVPRGWTAPRTGTRGDGQIASSASEAETIVPQGFLQDASELDPNPAIAVTFAPATRPAPNAGRESTKFPDTASRRRSNLIDDDHVKIAARLQPFAGYEIIEELGRGGMGVVHRTRCLDSGSLVALKVVLPAVASSPDDLVRVVREASIVKELTHPHIVPFRDLDHAEGQLFFVMDYVPGVDGQLLLRPHAGPLPVPRAIGIACQLLEALSRRSSPRRCASRCKAIQPTHRDAACWRLRLAGRFWFGTRLSSVQAERTDDDRKHRRHAAVYGSRTDHALSRCHFGGGPVFGGSHSVPPAYGASPL